MTQTIEQLTARVRELEEDVERTNDAFEQEHKACHDLIEKVIPNINKQLLSAQAEIKRLKEESRDASLGLNDYYGRKLAAEQLNNKRLRKALKAVIKVHGYESGIPVEAISTQASTEALDAYVAEKVKEAYIPVTIDYGDGAEDVAFGNEHQARRLKKWLDKFFAQKEQIATLTRQRDLAVEAIRHCIAAMGSVTDVKKAMDWPQLHNAQMLSLQALDAIKESEGK